MRAEPTVDRDRMFAVLEHLASDDLQGRYTLDPDDIDRAAQYLAAAYREAGIAPVGSDYRMPYDVVAGTQPGAELNVWLELERHPHDLAAAGSVVAIANGGGEPAVGEVVFVDAAAGKLPVLADKIAVVWPETALDDAAVAALVQRLAKAGARGALLVTDGAMPSLEPLRAAVGDAIPTAIVAASALPEGAPIAAKTRPGPVPGVSLSLAATREDVLKKAPNVLAYLPGTDLAQEIVIVGAHYDHIGTADNGHFCRTIEHEDGRKDTVCNGADDNASGTAGVLEVARALAEAGYRPRRSLVFAHFSGEELGLHGSRALADNPPAVPPFAGGRVVAMINMDMIGRLGEKGLSIGGLSSSDGWMPLLEQAGDRGLPVIYERAVTSRSDHANWYRKKIPVLFFFTGLHDDYHRAGDETAKINVEGMEAILGIVLDVTRATADGARLPWADPRSQAEGEVVRLPGSDPATLETPAAP